MISSMVSFILTTISQALQKENIDEILQTFNELKDYWDSSGNSSAIQQHKIHVMAQVVHLACKKHRLNQLMPLLVGMDINEELINVMLTECITTGDLESAKLVEWIARANQAPLEDSTCVLLLKCFAFSPGMCEQIIKDVLQCASPKFSEELALVILDVCSCSLNKDMIDKCTAWQLMVSALKCGHGSLAAYLFETADTKKQILTIQKWWKHGHSKKLQKSSPKLNGMLDVSSRLSRVFQSASLECNDDFPWPSSLEPVKKLECADDSTSAGTASDSDHDFSDRAPNLMRETA